MFEHLVDNLVIMHKHILIAGARDQRPAAVIERHPELFNAASVGIVDTGDRGYPALLPHAYFATNPVGLHQLMARAHPAIDTLIIDDAPAAVAVLGTGLLQAAIAKVSRVIYLVASTEDMPRRLPDNEPVLVLSEDGFDRHAPALAA